MQSFIFNFNTTRNFGGCFVPGWGLDFFQICKKKILLLNQNNMFEINPPTTVCYGGPGGTHTRPKYWRKISCKISRLSPKLRNFMSATSPVRETWRQILCLRLHPMAQKGHQRLKYWCQISWKNIHDLSPSISCLRLFTGREILRQISRLRLSLGREIFTSKLISCLRLSLGHKICLEYFSSKLGWLSFNTFH